VKLSRWLRFWLLVELPCEEEDIKPFGAERSESGTIGKNDLESWKYVVRGLFGWASYISLVLIVWICSWNFNIALGDVYRLLIGRTSAAIGRASERTRDHSALSIIN